MASTQTSQAFALKQSVDAVRESVERLESFLPDREDSSVLADFIEDDLREGLDAVATSKATLQRSSSCCVQNG